MHVTDRREWVEREGDEGREAPFFLVYQWVEFYVKLQDLFNEILGILKGGKNDELSKS